MVAYFDLGGDESAAMGVGSREVAKKRAAERGTMAHTTSLFFFFYVCMSGLSTQTICQELS